MIPQHSKKNAKRGIALIEVLVALAITSSALVLVLSSIGTAFRQSTRDYEAMGFELAAESKLAEVLAGVETSSSGVLDRTTGATWQVTGVSPGLQQYPRLERLTLTAFRSDGSKMREWSTLRRVNKRSP